MSKTEPLNPYQAILRKAHEKRIPLSAHWELTYACNLSCVHCYATAPRREEELGLPEIGRILDELAGAGCLFLTFTGGEVFCRPDILSVLAAARQRNFAIRLLTNGTLVTQEIAERLAGLNLLRVDISLYAVDPETHDRITGVPGSQAASASAVRLCRAAGIPVAVKTVFLKQNMDEFDALKRWAREEGTEFVFDYLLMRADDGSSPMDRHGLSDEEIRDFVTAHATAGREPPGAPDPADPVCGAGSSTLAISPCGDVFPCLGYREVVGNLRREPLATVWRAPLLDRLHNARYDDYAQCRDCGKAAFCSRCPGWTRAECGRPFERSAVFCMAAEAAMKAAGALQGKK